MPNDIRFMYHPVSPFLISQRFGENRACIEIGGTKVITCDGTRPPKGYKSVYGDKGHLGVDLRAKHGQEVYCSQRGKISSIDTNPRTGLDVRIISVIGGIEYQHIYEHLQGYQHEVGTEVETGELIGWADNTGKSSGDHLHWQLNEWDGKKWVPVDPLLYTVNLFARDVLPTMAKIREMVARLSDSVASYLRNRGK